MESLGFFLLVLHDLTWVALPPGPLSVFWRLCYVRYLVAWSKSPFLNVINVTNKSSVRRTVFPVEGPSIILVWVLRDCYLYFCCVCLFVCVCCCCCCFFLNSLLSRWPMANKTCCCCCCCFVHRHCRGGFVQPWTWGLLADHTPVPVGCCIPDTGEAGNRRGSR